MASPIVLTPAQILQAFLLAGSGAYFTDPELTPLQNWPLYVSAMPDGTGIPDNVAAIYDTEGSVLARLLTSGMHLNSYGVQLKSRSRPYTTGFVLLSNVAEMLTKLSLQRVAIGGNFYTIDNIALSSPVLSLGQDSQRRALHSLNMQMMLIET